MNFTFVLLSLSLFSVIVVVGDSFAELSDDGVTHTKKIVTVVQKIVDGVPVIEKYETEGKFYVPPPPTLVGCEKTSGWIPWEPNSKIMPDLQAGIDAGKEKLCVEIVLPFVSNIYSSNQDDLDYVLYNLDTLSKFIEDNEGTLEQNRQDIRKYIDFRSMHIGAVIPTSLILELVEREEIVSLDVYGKIPYIPSHALAGYDSKVLPDLKNKLDSGQEMVLVAIVLQGDKREAKIVMGHSIMYHTPLLDSEIKIMHESLTTLLRDNDVDIQQEFISINTIIATVPASFIPELEKLDEVIQLDTFDYVITSSGNDNTSSGEISISDNVNDDIILDITLYANSTKLSISGDVKDLMEIPVPEYILENNVDVFINDVIENNYKVIFMPDSNQTLLTFQPILFQDIIDDSSSVMTSDDSDLNNDVVKESDNITIPVDSKKQFKPPLKQIQEGISSNNIQCNDELVIVKKHDKNFSVCVKPSTAEKLIERGWDQ